MIEKMKTQVEQLCMALEIWNPNVCAFVLLKEHGIVKTSTRDEAVKAFVDPYRPWEEAGALGST